MLVNLVFENMSDCDDSQLVMGEIGDNFGTMSTTANFGTVSTSANFGTMSVTAYFRARKAAAKEARRMIRQCKKENSAVIKVLKKKIKNKTKQSSIYKFSIFFRKLQ